MVSVKGSLAEMKPFLRAGVGPILALQHAAPTIGYEIAGDRGATKTTYYYPMTITKGRSWRMAVFGLRAIPDHLSNANGRRISRLNEEKCYTLQVADRMSEQLA